jgi:hypothetical protein
VIRALQRGLQIEASRHARRPPGEARPAARAPPAARRPGVAGPRRASACT